VVKLDWREFTRPDSIPNSDFSQWSRVHSYGRETLVRTDIKRHWFCIDHETGVFKERPDIPNEANFAGELGNGTLVYILNGPQLFVCSRPGNCIDIDSVAPGFRLSNYSIARVVHGNSHIVVEFRESPFAVIVDSTGYEVIDIRKYVPEATSISFTSGLAKGLVFSTVTHSIFLRGEDSIVHVVRHNYTLDSRKAILASSAAVHAFDRIGLVRVDFLSAATYRCGFVEEVDHIMGTSSIRFRDVFPLAKYPFSSSEQRDVLRIDTMNASPFRLSYTASTSFDPMKVSLFETDESATQRHEALFGCSWLWQVSQDITASGGPLGLRIERHVQNATAKVRADTVTMFGSVDNGSKLFAGHRGLWVSQDTGLTWSNAELPGIQLVGFRGYQRAFNSETISPIQGGLYMRGQDRQWKRVDAVGSNYITGITVEGDDTKWVVSTTAQLEVTATITASDTTMTQADVLQGDIEVHRSNDRGLSWERVHTARASGVSSAITGCVSAGSRGGRYLGVPRRLLHLPAGASTFMPLDTLPFNANGFSARADSVGNAWVATSEGVFIVDPGMTSSVPTMPSVTYAMLLVQPNPIPSRGMATVKCEMCTNNIFEITDLLGRSNSTIIDSRFSASTLLPGIYGIHCVYDGKRSSALFFVEP